MTPTPPFFCPHCQLHFHYDDLFADHLAALSHMAAVMTTEHRVLGCLHQLCDLLQRVVDQESRKPETHWSEFPYKCMACRMGWATYEEADPHWQSGEHERQIALRRPPG